MIAITLTDGRVVYLPPPGKAPTQKEVEDRVREYEINARQPFPSQTAE
jgi:hypothetical protein